MENNMIDLAKKIDFNMKTFNYLHTNNHFYIFDPKMVDKITIEGRELLNKMKRK